MHNAGELDRRVRDALPEWRMIVVGCELVKQIARLARAVERCEMARSPDAPVAQARTRPTRTKE